MRLRLYLTAVSTFLAEPNVIAIEPSGKWILEEGRSSCLLARNLVANGQKLRTSILPHPGIAVTDVVLQGSLPSSKRIGARAKVSFGQSGLSFAGSVRTGSHDQKSFQQITLPSTFADDPHIEEALDISDGSGYAMTFHLPGLRRSLDALKMCESDLLKSWGIDEERFRQNAPGMPGFVDLTRYIRWEDYPEKAHGAFGATLSLLTITAEGRVSDCRTIESSGNVAVDDRSCAIAIKRFRYPPFRDKTGQKVVSWSTYGLRWKAP